MFVHIYTYTSTYYKLNKNEKKCNCKKQNEK